MRMKKITQYSLSTYIPGYLICFGIILALVHIGVIISVSTDSNGGMSGMDSVTNIFMLVVGITGFRETLSMSIQNGVSRKTYFAGTALFFVIFALIGSVGDTIMNVIGNAYEGSVKHMIYASMYEQQFLYEGGDLRITPEFTDYMKAFVLQLTGNIAFLSGGLLIGSAFYRMNKVMKFAVPAAIYIIFFIILPIIDAIYFDAQITEGFMKFTKWVNENWINMSGIKSLAAIILLGVSYLFIRRAQIRDRA